MFSRHYGPDLNGIIINRNLSFGLTMALYQDTVTNSLLLPSEAEIHRVKCTSPVTAAAGLTFYRREVEVGWLEQHVPWSNKCCDVPWAGQALSMRLRGLCPPVPALPAQGFDLQVHMSAARAVTHITPPSYRHRLFGAWPALGSTQQTRKSSHVKYPHLPDLLYWTVCPSFLPLFSTGLHLLTSRCQNASFCSNAFWPILPL